MSDSLLKYLLPVDIKINQNCSIIIKKNQKIIYCMQQKITGIKSAKF